MRKFCLVACTSKKSSYPTSAEFLYQSALFDGTSGYAKTRCDAWFILSAKFGLLLPSDQIPPYDESLTSLTAAERVVWAKKVFKSLRKYLLPNDEIIFLAGKPYREHLEKSLKKAGFESRAPLHELGIGRQVSWLQKIQKERVRVKDVDRFYGLLKKLANATGDASPLRNLLVKRKWPDQGLYFFFEPTQFRMLEPFQYRVTRIGTHSVSHGSKSSLWNRLRTHRGSENGLGNHRGSIFRLHIGQTLAVSCGLESVFRSWGIGQSASKDIRNAEEALELEVSDVVGRMLVLPLEVGGESGPQNDRAYLERNLIGLLAGPNGPLDLPTSDWLGHWSSRAAIRRSGLWNVSHTDVEYDPTALDVLEQYILAACGLTPKVVGSLAPTDWHYRSRVTGTTSLRQIPLIGEDNNE